MMHLCGWLCGGLKKGENYPPYTDSKSQVPANVAIYGNGQGIKIYGGYSINTGRIYMGDISIFNYAINQI